MGQIDLFKEVKKVYLDNGGPMSNDKLYEELCNREVLSKSDLETDKVEIKGVEYSAIKRKIRWFQQTLKAAGVIEKDAEKRGFWKIAEKEKKLTNIKGGFLVLGFSTLLGFSAICDSKELIKSLDTEVNLFFSSPPYPLKVSRNYQNVSHQEYADWISQFVEVAVDKMAENGSLVLNLGNEIFIEGTPARSTYIERVVIAMEDRFGLYLMDRHVWASNKSPGPVHWASINRYHLNQGYEPILWFAKDPLLVNANNNRVLLPHSEKHRKFIESGGSKSSRVNGDGSNSVRVGSYGNITDGKIPRNVLEISNYCKDQRDYKRFCEDKGIIKHGATMPLKVAEFYVKFLSDEGDLCVDMFSGSGTFGVACELNNRRWILADKSVDYVMGSASRFVNFDGFEMANDLTDFII